jgi:hypothetical protein
VRSQLNAQFLVPQRTQGLSATVFSDKSNMTAMCVIYNYNTHQRMMGNEPCSYSAYLQVGLGALAQGGPACGIHITLVACCRKNDVRCSELVRDRECARHIVVLPAKYICAGCRPTTANSKASAARHVHMQPSTHDIGIAGWHTLG